VRFSTYAVPMIVGEIKRFLRDGSALKIGRSIRDVAYKAIQARERLVKAQGVDVSMYEIAAEIDIPLSEIAGALDAISDPMSLFEPVYSDNEDNIMLMEQIKDVKENDDKWLTDVSLKEAIALLSPKEKEIILLRYYIGRTQTEVSSALNISQAQVSRLEKSALGKIKSRIV
jgi:RNA polymerase sporulation-specific sigma factor